MASGNGKTGDYVATLFFVLLIGFALSPFNSFLSADQLRHPSQYPKILPKWHSEWSANSSQPFVGPSPTLTDDEQVGITFTQSFTSLAYNVTAIQQTDSASGTGPAYLLNGLSNTGYWYQIGLSWNWNPGYYPGTGFSMVYEVFDSTGKSIFPSNGGGGLQTFSGTVNNGDSVLLNLYFSSTYGVVMLAKDYTTGAYASETYSSESASKFIGLSESSNSNGFFTGLMTEWYHSAPYYGNEAKVTYSDSAFALSGGIMWADEFTVPNRQSLFAQVASYDFQIPLLAQRFSSNGITAYGTGYQFVTGQMSVVPFTASYTIAGGGSGYSPPTLSCAFNGATNNIVFGVPSLAFYVDSGSQWSFSNELSGSTLSERWQTSQQSTGTASSAPTVSLIYYHQYSVIFNYAVSGGGNPTSPSLASTQFGNSFSAALTTTPASVWLDNGAQYAVTPNPLPGSTSTERWYASSGSGVVLGSAQVLVAYNHQFLLQVTGAGSSSQWYSSGTAVTFSTGEVFGRHAGTGNRVSSYGIDGQSQTQVSPSTGNVTVSVTMNGPHSLSFQSVSQFQLTLSSVAQAAAKAVTPPTISGDTYWYDSGTKISVSLSGVSGRSGGTGTRVASYNWDGGPPVAETVIGVIAANATMDSSHTLEVTSVGQYQVSLDSGATSALATITPPTIGGDNYWYDSGTSISISLNGVWGRTNGQGSRLVSYSLNGVQTPASTTAQTTIPVASLGAPAIITTSMATQYFLTAASGSKASETAPSIAGDAGWFDSGTAVTVAYNYVWNPNGNQSRSNALSYSIDGGAATAVGRTTTGTFQVAVMMSSPHSVVVASVEQYSLSISGGANVSTSIKSPTSDGFYDAGTTAAVSSNYTWDVVNGNTRQNLVSYSLDGLNKTVPRADSGMFATPQITFDSAHSISFNPTTQYLLTFGFVDGSQKHQIVPQSFAISLNGASQMVNRTAWLDTKTSFTVSSVKWEGTEVRPLNPITYQVEGHANITVTSRVYEASVKVTDALNFDVSGAQVVAKLANGTTVTMETNSNGLANLGLIPIGTYSASIMNLGLPISTSISADASTHSQAMATIYTSAAVLGASFLTIAAGIIIGVFFARSRRLSSKASSTEP